MDQQNFTPNNKIRVNIPNNECSINKIEYFEKLKLWIEDSLDLFKNDLIPLLYPLFIHIYLDLISVEKLEEAKDFFDKYKSNFDSKEIKQFEGIYSLAHIHQNSTISGFRNSKYFLVMSKYAYNLLINFIEENDMIYILKLMNSYMEIKVQAGGSGGQRQVGGIDAFVNDCVIDLTTNLVSIETEASILASEQYKHDHLETYVQQLKKIKKAENKIKPSPSLINAEIEKLKDICIRVSLNKEYLPSICCYTVQNTYENLTCMEISNDSKYMACGYNDSYIDIHSLTKEPLKQLKSSVELGKMTFGEKDSFEDKFDEIGEVKRLIGHTGPIFSLKFSNTGKYLISSSADCTIRLWSLELFTTIAVYKAHVFPVWTVDFSPNDFYFASGGADKQAILWCTKNNKPERLFLSSLSDVTVCKFHPNGNYLFTGSSDYKIRMHDIETAAVVRTFVGHTGGITCIDVHHDGKIMLSGGKDKKVILWDIEKSKVLQIFHGHESTIYSVSFSYFGSVICSSGADNSVRLWDKSDSKGTQLGVYYTKNTPVICAKFSYRNIISCGGPFI